MAVAVRSSAVAAPVPAPVRRPARRGQAVRRRSVLGGVLWIVALAGLLAGIVALNVALLDLNLRLDRLSRERAELRATNADLESKLSTADARVGPVARVRLGLVPATQEQTTFVHLGK
jgi:cell division protein FtsB